MTEFYTKPDFETARQTWSAFWRGENRRPLVSCVLPKDSKAAPCPSAYDLVLGNIDEVIKKTLAWAASHEFIGDTVPSFQITFAPDHFAALLGADIRFNPDSPGTNWVVPCLTDLDHVKIAFNPENRWWQRTRECIRAFREQCDGRLVISGPNLQGGLDCLAALRGTQALLFDLVISPLAVKNALQAIDRAVDDVRAALAEELNIKKYGSVTRHGMYSTGFIDIPQCDFSCMISEEMFSEFGLPSLAHEVLSLDAAEYHLDGPGAIRHLEAVCTIDKLSVIQWQPGAGAAAAQDWSELYRKIDRLGKGQIRSGDKESIKKMWSEFRSQRLFFHLSGAASIADACRQIEEIKAIEGKN